MFADNFDGEKQARKDEEEARKKEEEKAEADAMNLVMELKSTRIFRITANCSCRTLCSISESKNKDLVEAMCHVGSILNRRHVILNVYETVFLNFIPYCTVQWHRFYLFNYSANEPQIHKIELNRRSSFESYYLSKDFTGPRILETLKVGLGYKTKKLVRF